jgi:hypothetical protein
MSEPSVAAESAANQPPSLDAKVPAGQGLPATVNRVLRRLSSVAFQFAGIWLMLLIAGRCSLPSSHSAQPSSRSDCQT